MSKKYLANTFSPMMLGENEWAEVTPIELEELPPMSELISAVSHEVTAKVLSALMGEEVPFNRINLTLELGDVLYCVIPNFRAQEAREFTYEEVANAGYRCFQVSVSPGYIMALKPPKEDCQARIKMEEIGYDWRLVKKLFPPRTRKTTIEKQLVEWWKEGKYDFASHRIGELYNYKLNIPNGDYMHVGWIRLRRHD